MDNQPDLTVETAANKLAVSRVTVYKMIHAGLLHAYKVGRCTRITNESLELLRTGGDL